MKVYQVRVTWPSGLSILTNLAPGTPHAWANRGEASPTGEVARAILNEADAEEYCMRSLHNQPSPVEIEWPQSAKCEGTVDKSIDEVKAVVKGLQTATKKAGE